MKKLTKSVVEILKKGNVVFEKDGFIKILTKDGDNVLDWVNADTLNFIVDAKYDELEKECDAFWKAYTEKKYEGLSAMESIEKAESEYSEHDKAMIASVRGNNKVRGF